MDEDEDLPASPGAERRLAIIVVTSAVLGVAARVADLLGAQWLVILCLTGIVAVFIMITVLEARAQKKTVREFVRATNRRIIRQIGRRFRRSSS